MLAGIDENLNSEFVGKSPKSMSFANFDVNWFEWNGPGVETDSLDSKSDGEYVEPTQESASRGVINVEADDPEELP